MQKVRAQITVDGVDHVVEFDGTPTGADIDAAADFIRAQKAKAQPKPVQGPPSPPPTVAPFMGIGKPATLPMAQKPVQAPQTLSQRLESNRNLQSLPIPMKRPGAMRPISSAERAAMIAAETNPRIADPNYAASNEQAMNMLSEQGAMPMQSQKRLGGEMLGVRAAQSLGGIAKIAEAPFRAAAVAGDPSQTTRKAIIAAGASPEGVQFYDTVMSAIPAFIVSEGLGVNNPAAKEAFNDFLLKLQGAGVSASTLQAVVDPRLTAEQKVKAVASAAAIAAVSNPKIAGLALGKLMGTLKGIKVPAANFENVPLVNAGRVAEEQASQFANLPSQQRLRKMMGESYLPEETPNASKIQGSTEVYGNMPTQPVQGKVAMPPQEGGAGVQPNHILSNIPENANERALWARKLKEHANNAREALRRDIEEGNVRLASGLDPVHMGRMVVIAADHLVDTAYSVAETARRLVQEFGIRKTDATEIASKALALLSKGASGRVINETQQNSKYLGLANEIAQAFPSQHEFEQAALLGQAKKGWYERAHSVIKQIFGDDAPDFTAVLAATSPQQGVRENLKMALRVYDEWVKAGRPRDEATLRELFGPVSPGSTIYRTIAMEGRYNNTVNSLANPQDWLSGFKVESFRRNLMGDYSTATNDAWMSNFARQSQSLFSKPAGYDAMEGIVARAAKSLTKKTGQTWTPANVQETVWSFYKTLEERAANTSQYKSASEAMKSLTHADVAGDADDFAVLFKTDDIQQMLKGHGANLDHVNFPEINIAEGKIVDTAGVDPRTVEVFNRRADSRLYRRDVVGRLADGKDVGRLQADSLALGRAQIEELKTLSQKLIQEGVDRKKIKDALDAQIGKFDYQNAILPWRNKVATAAAKARQAISDDINNGVVRLASGLDPVHLGRLTVIAADELMDHAGNVANAAKALADDWGHAISQSDIDEAIKSAQGHIGSVAAKAATFAKFGNDQPNQAQRFAQQGKEVTTNEETQTRIRSTVQGAGEQAGGQGVQPGSSGGVNRSQEVRQGEVPSYGSQGQKEGIATKNASTSQIRKEMDLQDLPKPERETFEQWMKKAEDLGTDPMAAANRVLSEGGTLETHENGAIVKRLAELKLAYKKAAEAGDMQAMGEILDQTDKLTKATNQAGTTAARNLVARKLQVGGDDALSNIVRAQHANPNVQLEPKLKEKITAMSDATEKLNEQISKLEAGQDANLEEVVKATAAKKRLKSKEQLDAELAKILNESKKRMAGSGPKGTQSGAVRLPFDPVAAGQLAWHYVERGASKLEDVIMAVQSHFPDATDRQIRDAMLGKHKEKPSIDAIKAELQQMKRDVKRQAELTNQIEDLKAGKSPEAKTKTAQEQSEELKRLIAERDELSKRKYTQDQIKDMESQLASGNVVAPVKKGAPVVSKELDALRFKRDQLRSQIDQIIKDREPKGVFDRGSKVVSSAREPVASGDNSFGLNQGAMALATDPKAWAKGMKASFKGGATKKGAYDVVQEIISHPKYEMANRAKLFESDVEDIFGGGLMKDIPVIGHGERAYSSNAAQLRMSMFDDWTTLLEKYGKKPVTPEQAKRVASAIKTITGQGEWGKNLQTISKPFMALRYALSTVETAVGAPLLREVNYATITGDWSTSRLLLRKYSQAYAMAIGAAYMGDKALEKAYGDQPDRPKIDLDPLSPSFGNLTYKKGKTTVSIGVLPPQMQMVGKGLQLATALTRYPTGRESKGSMQQTQLLGQQVLYKMNPVFSIPLQIAAANRREDKTMFGKQFDFQGNPVGAAGNVAGSFLPISVQNIIQNVKNSDLSPEEKLFASAFGFFGRINVSEDTGKTKTPTYKPIKIAR